MRVKQIDTLDSFQKSARAMPFAPLSAPVYQDFAGQQRQDSIRAMAGVSGEINKIVLEYRNRADQLALDESLNALKQASLDLELGENEGYARLNGAEAIHRPDKQSLTEEYYGKLQKRAEEIAGKLGDDRLRQEFAKRSADTLLSFQEGVLKHELQQYNTHELSVAEGIQATEIDNIKRHFNDPEAVDASVQRIRAQVYRQAKLLGKSAEWQEAAERKMTSEAHKTAILAALENKDPAYANAYLEKYGKQMDADDILKVRGQITQEVNTQEGVAAASEVMRGVGSRMAPDDLDRAVNITAATESGNRQFGPDGKPLTSPKGAVGVMQVMKETGPEAAKLAGLPWDEERWRNDPEYNMALGRAYLKEQLRVNGGDLAKAWAAYNAGPGRLAEAIKKAEDNNRRVGETERNLQREREAGRPVAGNDPVLGIKTWMDFMPKETQDYVVRNVRAYESGKGRPPRPTLSEVDEQLRTHPGIANNPERYKIAKAVLKERFEQFERAQKDEYQRTLTEAQDLAFAKVGGWRDISSAQWAALKPEDRAKLIKGPPKADDPETLFYLQQNPEEWQKGKIEKYRDLLTEEKYRELYGKGNNPQANETIREATIDTTQFNDTLYKAGLDYLIEAKEGHDDRKILYDLRSKFQQIIESEQTVKKRKLSLDEKQNLLNQLVKPVKAKVITEKWGFGLLGGNEAVRDQRVFQVENPGNIIVPDEARGKIIADLKKRGIQASEEDILAAYLRMPSR